MFYVFRIRKTTQWLFLWWRVFSRWPFAKFWWHIRVAAWCVTGAFSTQIVGLWGLVVVQLSYDSLWVELCWLKLSALGFWGLFIFVWLPILLGVLLTKQNYTPVFCFKAMVSKFIVSQAKLSYFRGGVLFFSGEIPPPLPRNPQETANRNTKVQARNHKHTMNASHARERSCICWFVHA